MIATVYTWTCIKVRGTYSINWYAITERRFFLTYSENTFKAKNVVDLFFGSKYFFLHMLTHSFIFL